MNTYVRQCADEGVGPYNRHNLHGTDHMQIYKQRIADLQYLVIVSIENYILLITQERLVKMKFRKSILLY